MKKNRYMILLAVMVILYASAVLLSYVWMQREDAVVINIDDQWKVFLNGEHLGLSGESETRADIQRNLNQGGELVYVTTLKDMGHIQFPALMFSARYCAYEIYLDDHFISGRSGGDANTQGYIGRERRIVTLPSDYVGRELKLVMHTDFAYGGAGLMRSFLGERSDLESEQFQFYSVAFASGVFLILFGAIYLFIIFIMSSWMPMMKTYIPLTILTTLMGVLVHTRYSVTAMFMDTALTSRFYDFVILLVIPVGIFCGKALCKKDDNKVIRRIENVVLFASAGIILLRFVKGSYVYPLFFGLTVITVGLLGMRTYRIKKYALFTDGEWLLLNSLWAAILSPMLSLTLSGLVMLGVIADTFLVDIIECNMFCVGPVFLGYFLLLDFLMNISNVQSKKQEYESLAYLGYSDDLTGLANRAKYVKELETLEKVKADYCIISFDMDGLKAVNDTYGHTAGDRLLKTFSEKLREVYGEGFVARIGGDEFVAILEHDEEYASIETIRHLREKLNEENEKGIDPWEYGVSAGYAYRHECEEDHMHQTYLLADQRMYDDKNRRKKERMGDV